MADLDEAIRVAQEILNAIPKNHPDRARQFNDLGVQLRERYSRKGAIADLQEAIRITQEAVDATPEDHPDRARLLSNLGSGLGERYSRIGAIADLEKAILFMQKAVNATAEDHPDRPRRLNNLGILLFDRYSRTGTMNDLNEAIRTTQEAENNLAAGLSDRYSRTRAIADLEGAIRTVKEAVDATPVDHPGRVILLTNLGLLLSDRHLRRGAIADLEEAIRITQEAVDATPEHHPDRARRLNSLGNRLSDRYSRTGAIADLEAAIQTAKEAVDATLKDHPNRPKRLNNLGIHLYDRYSRTGTIADLEAAIRAAKEAVNATPEDHPDRAGLLNNLGVGLSDKYSRAGAIVDLEEAIRILQEAVDAMREDHPDRVIPLSNLGDLLSDRHLRTGAIADLQEAIRITQEAVDATPEDHPDRAKLLVNLGNRLCNRYSNTGLMADLTKAISSYHSALHQLTSTTIIRIIAGRKVLQCCAIVSDWQQAYKASKIAVHLIPKLISRSLELPDKQHMLSQVVGLASDTTAVAFHTGKEPLVALDFLEQGRGVLATSLEEIRTDVLDLQRVYPKLADQFIRIRDELEQPIIRNNSLVAENRKSSWQAQASRRYEAGKKLDKLIDEIRKKLGSEDFLLAPSETEIQAAASCGPIAIINVSKYRCDALLVEQHQIQALALASLSREDIEEKAKAGLLGSPQVLEWLWETVTSPILDALGFTQPPSDDNWPHIWWIPTGPLSKFPLHAAGRHSKRSSETVLDRVMSSYSLSIKAIIHGRRRRVLPLAPAQALLVAMEHTPGNVPLPFATKEVAKLHDPCKSMALDPIEPGRRKQDVMSHLRDCKIFHFAGHGYTDDLNPSKSYLCLEDGKDDPLRVADLLEMNLRERSPFLAYLSACGTGQIKNEKFIDESIHLISACQLAGFRHVIGTLWEVNDELCVDMARITYEVMRDGCMTDESVCRGLHRASQELRDRWLNTIAKARRGTKSVGKVGIALTADETGAQSISAGNQRDDRLPRDIVLCDDDDNGWTGPLHWVPYVHFGV